MATLFDSNINSGAEFSEDRTCRYVLWRIWDYDKPFAMFIGLNPSKANEMEPDNTIKRVIAIAKYNGYGGIYMMNCFPFVSTDPDGLIIDVVSFCTNNNLLQEIAAKCSAVVFAWGDFKIVKKTGRDKELIAMFPEAKALTINKNGSPKHPLYCKINTEFINFNK